MTIFVTWQLIVTLDSIRNSCDVSSSFLLLFLFLWPILCGWVRSLQLWPLHFSVVEEFSEGTGVIITWWEEPPAYDIPLSLSSHGPSDLSTGFYFSLCLLLRKTQLTIIRYESWTVLNICFCSQTFYLSLAPCFQDLKSYVDQDMRVEKLLE